MSLLQLTRPFRLAVASAAFLGAHASLAQTSFGIIHGQVTDASGGVIPNATILARSPVVGGTFTALTDQQGNYRLTDLPEGTDYTLEANTPGFERFVRKDLIVRSGLNVTVDVTLQVGSQSDSVQVTGDTPLIDTQSAEQSVNLSGEMLRNIPITGRHDWSDSLQITPGIVSASSDAEGGQTYFLRGSENENHATLLDGMDVGSFEQNWPSNTISIANESLGDIQIKTGANDASSPAAMGMVINIASPAGSDQYHGSVLWLFGPAAWNANNVPQRQRGRLRGRAARLLDRRPHRQAAGLVLRLRPLHSPQRRHQPDCRAGRLPSADQSGLLPPLPTTRVASSSSATPPYSSPASTASWRWSNTTAVSRTPTSSGTPPTSRTIRTGGLAVGLRLLSQWSERFNTRFLVSYNNKGANTSLAAIDGVGSKPEIDIYTTDTQSAGTLLGQGSSLATLNNLNSVTTNPASKPTVTGDADYYLPKLAGTHELQFGYYLEPKELSKVTTYYANGGGIIQENAVLNNPANPAQGYTVFSAETVNNVPSLVTNYTGASDLAYYVQDRWHPFPRLTITAGVRPDWISGYDYIAKQSIQHSWNRRPARRRRLCVDQEPEKRRPRQLDQDHRHHQRQLHRCDRRHRQQLPHHGDHLLSPDRPFHHHHARHQRRGYRPHLRPRPPSGLCARVARRLSHPTPR